MAEKKPVELKEKEATIIESWNELMALLKDGKVEPKEVPYILLAVAGLVQAIGAVLVFVKIDPKVQAIMGVIGSFCETTGENLKKLIPSYGAAGEKIGGVLNDGKIDVREIPVLIEGLVQLTAVIIMTVSPFVTKDSLASVQLITDKLKRLLAWVKIIPAVAPSSGANPDGGGSARKTGIL